MSSSYSTIERRAGGRWSQRGTTWRALEGPWGGVKRPRWRGAARYIRSSSGYSHEILLYCYKKLIRELTKISQSVSQHSVQRGALGNSVQSPISHIIGSYRRKVALSLLVFFKEASELAWWHTVFDISSLGLFEGIFGFIVARSRLGHILGNFSHPLNFWVRVNILGNYGRWGLRVDSRLYTLKTSIKLTKFFLKAAGEGLWVAINWASLMKAHDRSDPFGLFSFFLPSKSPDGVL